MNRNTLAFQEAEYRVKISHFTNQGYDITGVVHVGTNDGYEMQWYKQMGIENLIGFDPLPQAVVRFSQKYPDIPIYQRALSNKDGWSHLNVTYGDGAGSSLFNQIDESGVVQSWDDNKDIVGRIPVQTTRFDAWAMKHDFDPDLFDCLVLDTQGNELDVLKGMGNYLGGFKFLNIELSKEPVYEGETPGAAVAAWLKNKGYTLDSPLYDHNDSFFVRSDIKPTSDEQYRGLA